MRYGVNVIGKAEVTNPSGAGNDGRVADGSAYGDHAFLTALRDPTGERAGAHVIDIGDPKAPVQPTAVSTSRPTHQSELSPDNRFLVGTDEDFNPWRVVAAITSGPSQGATFSASSASATLPIDAQTSITGTPTFVGLACNPLPAGSGVALIERRDARTPGWTRALALR